MHLTCLAALEPFLSQTGFWVNQRIHYGAHRWLKPLLLNCISPLEECHLKVPENDTDKVHCPTCTFLMIFWKVNVCGASWACPSAFCQNNTAGDPESTAVKSWGWIIYTTATQPYVPFSLLIFLQLQLWCWADGTLRSTDLGCKNTMKATPKRHVPVYQSYMVKTGSISGVLGERTEKLRDSWIWVNSDGIYLFLMYFSFVNLPIFLFECMSLSCIKNWGFACVRAHIN